jgi:3-dehydroquinate synthase
MATGTLEIVFPERNVKCSIFFGEYLRKSLPISRLHEASSIAIISDDNVSKLYGRRLRDDLSHTHKTHLVTIRHGERSKTLDTASRIAKRLSELGLDRNSVILAVGGGVIGDMAGFVASIFKRGIRYFQLPTTLLAQVDSSIGGKCAVDTSWGKNQLGTFYQPEGIFIDLSVLDSLPSREVVNGVAEIVKSGIIAERTMFEDIERSSDLFEVNRLKGFVPRTVAIKAGVVQADEKEANVRKILNYGHTVGHAIESSSNYRLSHGKCVILGMLCEGWIARKLGIFDESDYLRQSNVLERIRSSHKIVTPVDPKIILSFAALDKKNVSGSIRMSLPEKLGVMSPGDNGSYAIPISKDIFLDSLLCLNKQKV